MFSDVQMKLITTKLKIQPLEMDESLMTLNLGFGFNANNFMYSLTQDVMDKLLPMGIIQHWMDADFLEIYKGFSNVKQPKVLNVEDLSFGFVLWLLACGLSCGCFLVEVLYERLKEVVRMAVGLVLMFKVLYDVKYHG